MFINSGMKTGYRINCNIIGLQLVVKADGKSPSYVVMVHYISGRVVNCLACIWTNAGLRG